MSDPGRLTIGIVAEGPTDHAVLRVIASRLARGRRVRVLALQPEMSATFQRYGVFGAGWKGVWQWCRAQAGRPGGLVASLSAASGGRIDVLIVHVDADIAADAEIDRERPCPPASATTQGVRDVVKAWLVGTCPLPDNVVLAVPSKATETWILAALVAHTGFLSPCTECTSKPERILTRQPFKHLQTRGGEPKKSVRIYEGLAQKFVGPYWEKVCASCGEASTFDGALARSLTSGRDPGKRVDD